MDLDINNYSIDELLSIIEINNSEINANTIKEKLIITLNNINDKSNNHELINFLKNVGIKLYSYYGFEKNIHELKYLFKRIINPMLYENVQLLPFENNFNKNTFSNNYQSDIINPIKKDVNIFSVNIDSIFRSDKNTNTNSFFYNFDTPLKNIISYKVQSIELPSVWYDLSQYKKNNQFTIITYNHKNNLNIDVSSTTHVINIPDGNYSVSELSTNLKNYFENIGNGLNYLTFEIDEINAKTIFRVKTNIDSSTIQPYNPSNAYYNPNFYFEIYFDLKEDIELRNKINILESKNECELICQEKKLLELNIRDFKKNFGYLIGFTKPYYKVNINNMKLEEFKITPSFTFKGYLESENVFGETIDRYILLYIDDFNNNVKNNFVTEGNLNSSNIIGKIPITSPSYSIINQNNNNSIYKNKEFYGPVNIKRINLQLLNKFGDLIDIKTNNWSLTLQFTQIYS